jgi:hypothetical protein
MDHPAHGLILPIGEVFERLRGAVGRSFPDAGWDQERNRGVALHRIVCKLLGYADYRGGSVCLNRWRAFSEWFSAWVMLPPLLASAD